MRGVALVLAVVVALAAGALPAVASRTLALIIGNDTYAQLPPLAKARSDAQGYAVFLGARGFEVHLHNDLSARAMGEALADFYDRIQPGDTVVFVYSGHGWSDGRENFLVPVDSRASGSQTLLAVESVPLRNGVNGILDQIAARAPGLTIAVIDACRNNPFTPAQGLRSVGLARGLSPVSAATGTFVAFSAGAGQTALDNLGADDRAPYSVFTRVFLEELARPQDLQAAFKATQARVNQIAGQVGHQQRPAYYDEVIGSACLTGVCAPDPGPQSLVVAALPGTAAADPMQVARDEWGDFQASGSVAALEAFAARHAGTPYELLARERIALLGAPAPGIAAAPAQDVAAVPLLALPPAQTFAQPVAVPEAGAAGGGPVALAPGAPVAPVAPGTADALPGDAGLEAALLARALPAARRWIETGQSAHVAALRACGADSACRRAADAARTAELRNLAALLDLDPVRRAQAQLNRMGCDAGPVDGQPGPRTRRALEAAARHAAIDVAFAALSDAQAVDALFTGGPGSCSVLAGGVRDPDVLMGAWDLRMQCPGTRPVTGQIEVRFVSDNGLANGPAGIGRKFGWHTLVPDATGATLTIRWADAAPTVIRMAPDRQPDAVLATGPADGCRTTVRRG